MSDLAAIHQKLSDALAKYEKYAASESGPDLLAAFHKAAREWDVARRAAPAAPECALSGGDCQYRTQPAEPAPPTATPCRCGDPECSGHNWSALPDGYRAAPPPTAAPAGCICTDEQRADERQRNPFCRSAHGTPTPRVSPEPRVSDEQIEDELANLGHVPDGAGGSGGSPGYIDLCRDLRDAREEIRRPTGCPSRGLFKAAGGRMALQEVPLESSSREELMEMVRDARAQLAEAREELRAIDMTLDRRTALDGLPSRLEKIRLAVQIAGSNDPKGQLAEAQRERELRDMDMQNVGSGVIADKLRQIAENGREGGCFGGEREESAAKAIIAVRERAEAAERREQALRAGMANAYERVQAGIYNGCLRGDVLVQLLDYLRRNSGEKGASA